MDEPRPEGGQGPVPDTEPPGDARSTAETGRARASKPVRKSSASPKPAEPTVRFEDAFARLEALVAEMERGELELEEMLARFEEGVALVRSCNTFLKTAQTRVEQYVEQQDGHWVLKDLDS